MWRRCGRATTAGSRQTSFSMKRPQPPHVAAVTADMRSWYRARQSRTQELGDACSGRLAMPMVFYEPMGEESAQVRFEEAQEELEEVQEELEGRPVWPYEAEKAFVGVKVKDNP